MENLAPLPIGSADFEDIRQNGSLYVDKTAFILLLLRSPNQRSFFLSRPRRFGKSLFLNTLMAFFQGKKELFEGLAVEKSDWEWKSYPVIKLDMTFTANCRNEDELNESLINQLWFVFEAYELTPPPRLMRATSLFSYLIQTLSKKGRVVVLIDEYDKPIVDNLEDVAVAETARKWLAGLYGQLKAHESHLRFIFITGVSRFAKLNLFSSLNNIIDLMYDASFSAICGYTQTELETYFDGYLSLAGEKFSLSRPLLLEKLKKTYNGYNFGGNESVYNPLSILSFFHYQKFDSYWFYSGAPTFLIKELKKRNFYLPDLENLEATRLDLDSPNLSALNSRGLLWQTGYLTPIKEPDNVRVASLPERSLTFTLGFPNFEVRNALLDVLAIAYLDTNDNGIFYGLRREIHTALHDGEAALLCAALNRMLNLVPYDLHLPREAYYHSLFYVFLNAADIDARAEVHHGNGRLDLIIVLPARVWIMELKYAPSGEPEPLYEQAFAQIRARGYPAPYLNQSRPIHLLALVIVGKTLSYQEEIL